MRSGIGTQTNRFEMYDSDTGKRMRGVVTVQLPAFELASNEFSGAGVGGSINVPAPGNMNALPCTISVPKIYGDIIQYLKLGTTKTIDLRADVAVVDSETHAVLHVPERWVLKGPITKSDPGKVENKAAGDATIELQTYYAVHYLDGSEVLEWDVFNAVHRVDGTDLLSETKSNIGL